MKNLLQSHPEVKSFSKDQKVMSQYVKYHMKEVKDHYGMEIHDLNLFLKKFSQLEKFSSSSLSALPDLEGAISYLKSASKSFPIPLELSGIKRGLYLDLRNEKNITLFQSRIIQLIKRVQILPQQKKRQVNLTEMGHIPLQQITDPLLCEKINKIWTLDVTKNPGLSIKDIMAKQMVEDAFKDGSLDQTKIIVEGTSGNTGVGLALVAAVYGIKIILVTFDKVNQEKIDRLTMLGAHVIVTPTRVNAHSPFSYYAVRDFVTKRTHGWGASQYDNLSNRKAHEMVTGPEIWEQTKGEITVFIAPAGTCGTVSGVASYLKKKNPRIKIIAVDTIGSILYLLHAGYSIQEVQKYASSYTIQGFGEDIHPQNLDSHLIDSFIRISDADGLYMTRYLPMIGFVAGQSSGAAYAALWKLVKQQVINHHDSVVVIFPDTGIPYRTDVFSDNWVKTQNKEHILY